MGSIVSSLFKITEHALSLYKTRESRKYLDRVIYLKKSYDRELAKNENIRNHAFMDNIINELCIITETIASFGKTSAQD